MNNVYVISDNIINSLGFTTEEVASSLKNGITGFRNVSDRDLTPSTVPLSLVDNIILEKKFSEIKDSARKRTENYTRMEKMIILSVHESLSKTKTDPSDSSTLLIISTTKGNIDLLSESEKSKYPEDRVMLWKMAQVIADFFGFVNTPMVVSNACISGVMALGIAARYIRQGIYKDIVVAGGDMATEFVISGFLSFQALSNEPCKPFDAGRTGLSLGEGAGTIILSQEPGKGDPVRLSGAAITNDANHISGPSRTGEELALAMERAMKEAGVTADDVDFVSAHGTATMYNDEMESKALTIAGLDKTFVNSFKGYWGHTLGAAGIIESAMTVHSMKENILYRSPGFSETGTPHPLNVLKENVETPVNCSLKIASGFGGCNGALIFQKG